MREDTTKTIEGYHGTIFENLDQGLDKELRYYDKSRAVEVAIPENLDITFDIHRSIVLAYRLGWETSEENSLYSLDSMRKSVLLYGKRINASTIEIQRIMRFLLPEGFYLSRSPLDLVLEEITEEFFS